MAPRESRTSYGQRGFSGTDDDTHTEVDRPRSIGFFGALGVAVALDLVSIPIAVFVAAVPFLKMMNRPNAPRPQRFFSHLVDGAPNAIGLGGAIAGGVNTAVAAVPNNGSTVVAAASGLRPLPSGGAPFKPSPSLPARAAKRPGARRGGRAA